MEIIGDSTQNSDDENVVNLANTNRRNYRIIDSDSETDDTNQHDPIITTNNPQNDSDNSDNEEDSKSLEAIPKNKPKRIKIVDSDSDREDSEIIPTNKAESIGNSNFNSLYDSESSDDDRNQSKKSKRSSRKTNNDQKTDSDSNHKADPTDNDELIANPTVHKSNLNSLYDPESSDDDTRTTKPTKPRSSRKMKDSNDGPKKLKSGKEAVEQRKEIAAESQRMLRESRVSLPYHVPKVHSLKEFLEKRPRLTATVNLSENTPLPIKMTKDQLETVSKKLDERIREVEEFYKSDNESDTEIVEEDIEQTRIEIRNWLDSLVDTAMDSVEIQLNKEMPLECGNVEENEINQEEEPRKLSKYAILTEKLANIQPKLSGSPDEIIDLETGLTRRSEIRKLVDKYIEHTIPKHLHKDKVETNVISVSGGDIREETVTLRIDDDEIVPKFEIPGAKLKKLKEKLINEMAEKRSELWQQKNVTITDDKSNNKDDYEDDYLDDEEEEEFELTATSSEEDIDEDDVDEFDLKSKNKPKCSFFDDEAEVDDEVEEIEENSDNSKKLKRVIAGFNDDDTDEDVDNTIIDKPNLKNDTQDDFVVPNVPKINQISPREKPQLELDFLTPVTFITGLQNLNSDKLQESPIISPFKLPTQPSPLRGDKWQSNLQKKLFQEPCQQPEQEEETPTTQDLLEICSGEFPDSQQQQHTNIILNENKEIKELDQDNDNLISQLLIEDDLEEFEKQLNSNNNGGINEIKPTGIIDSDSENDEIDLKQQKKKKFIISDESSDDNEDNDEKPIDLHDNTGLDEDIDYDSEENEIDESKKFNVNDFVEQEAELSESEWGSDDEDENNLDEMELEQGDKEEFDENKIRTDIEKIHMRRLLDDDTREIKLLQELLLEDGELHGTGRQRQFRWRNIDIDGDEDQNKDEDGVYLDDEETEEEWRKMRHKREMFLKQNSQNDDSVETILQNSKILKIKQNSIRTSQSFNNSQKSIKTTENTDEIIGLSIKRGSFLSRNDQVLQRLAEYTKVSTNIVGTTKNSKSFVFKSTTETKRKATEETPKALKKIRLDNFSPAVGKPSSSKKLF